MQNLIWHPEKPTLHEALGISEERLKKLNFLYRVAGHRLNEPREDGEVLGTPSKLLDAVLQFAENAEESIYLTYKAGRYVESRVGCSNLASLLKDIE